MSGLHDRREALTAALSKETDPNKRTAVKALLQGTPDGAGGKAAAEAFRTVFGRSRNPAQEKRGEVVLEGDPNVGAYICLACNDGVRYASATPCPKCKSPTHGTTKKKA